MARQQVDLQASVVQSFQEWLALGGGGFNHASKRQCENLSLWREKRMYRIRPVSGYLLATYHDSRSNSLTIENLATGCPSVFSDSDLKDFEDVIGVVSDNQYLVSTRYGDAELRLLTLNGTNGAIREICRWDSSNLVVKTSMHCTGGVVHPNLTCAVNASRSSVVILGPTEANTTGMQCHGRPDPRQGIKCIHLKQDPLVIQEYPSVGTATAINAVFNPCPGKDHLLTLALTEELRNHFIRPCYFRKGFLAIYDTRACQYAFVARKKYVTTNILIYSRDGALLFVLSEPKHRNHRIELLDSESLDVLACVAHEVGSFLPVLCESYRLLYPVFPLLTADNSRFVVLSGTSHPNTSFEREERLTVSVYSIPLFLQRQSLLDACRRYIRALVPDDKHVELLPLPRPLHKYLLWQSQRTIDN